MGKRGNKKRREKTPSRAFTPEEGKKKPRGGLIADNVSKSLFTWRVGSAELEGPWGWGKADIECVFREVLPKLHDFESMTWADIEGRTNSHFVAYDKLCKTAQARLGKLGQVDTEQLFSLRITGERRVWGPRDGKILRIFWWDPKHEVCPAKKKNT